MSGICGFRSTWVPDVGKAYVNPDVASVGAIAGIETVKAKKKRQASGTGDAAPKRGKASLL